MEGIFPEVNLFIFGRKAWGWGGGGLFLAFSLSGGLVVACE